MPAFQPKESHAYSNHGLISTLAAAAYQNSLSSLYKGKHGEPRLHNRLRRSSRAGFHLRPHRSGSGQRGHEVVQFTDYMQFERESSTVLRSTGVLLAVSNFPCTRELMTRAPELRAIVSPFIGTEGFDEAAATALGIIVANGQVAENFLSMAESTILLILSSLYSLHWWEEQLRNNRPISAGSRTNARRQNCKDDRFRPHSASNDAASAGMGRPDSDLYPAASQSDPR